MKIVIIGMGYVGMSIAVLLAQQHHVIGVDIDPKKIELINNKKSPFKDSDIEQYLARPDITLEATLNGEQEYQNADFVVIATPTNYDSENKCFDTSNIEHVIEQVHTKNKQLYIIIKSTVPIGFTQRMQNHLGTSRILFSPEFLREDRAMYDLLHPSRIIIGVNKCCEQNIIAASEFATLLHKSATKENVEILIMAPSEAEAVKLFSNAYLALRVAFFNELDTYGIVNSLNIKAIIRGISLDPRIGEYYNNPSFGYGGYCLPKDTKQLLAEFANIPENIISAIVNSNLIRKKFIAEQIFQRINNRNDNLENQSYIVGIYRLIMKKNSDNFRDSSILEIINYLKLKGVTMIIYEPLITERKYDGIPIEENLTKFKLICDLVITNRMEKELEDVVEKVYTRDLFFIH